jgi:hypothetical protein
MAATIKLRNDRGVIPTSDQSKAEIPEEQHYITRHAHTQFFLLCIGRNFSKINVLRITDELDKVSGHRKVKSSV